MVVTGVGEPQGGELGEGSLEPAVRTQAGVDTVYLARRP